MNDKIPGLGLIVVAGGSSTRYGNGNKLFAELGSLPVFIHSLKTLAPLAEHTVLVVPQAEKENFADRLKSFLPALPIRLTAGGADRTASVKNGLSALPADTEIAAIHDAARPLVRAELLERLVQTVKQHRCGAIAAEKMIDSVCRTDAEFEITANVPREDLWRIQTPQVFLYSEICSAYARLGETSLTDDSAAARACGYPVMVVENPHPNLKLTTQSDLPLLHFLSKNV